jgi:hypothetical protein
LTPTFFTDRDLGKQFPAILSAAGLSVERHQDHFAPDAIDEEWLEFVGRSGWVALTHDRRIRYAPNELAAVIRSRVALLIVIGKTPLLELARAFVSTYPRIEEFLSSHTPPYIGKVYRPSHSEKEGTGRVELWYPARGR